MHVWWIRVLRRSRPFDCGIHAVVNSRNRCRGAGFGKIDIAVAIIIAVITTIATAIVPLSSDIRFPRFSVFSACSAKRRMRARCLEKAKRKRERERERERREKMERKKRRKRVGEKGDVWREKLGRRDGWRVENREQGARLFARYSDKRTFRRVCLRECLREPTKAALKRETTFDRIPRRLEKKFYYEGERSITVGLRERSSRESLATQLARAFTGSRKKRRDSWNNDGEIAVWSERL